MEARSQLRHRPNPYRWGSSILPWLMMTFTRDQAWNILCEFTQSDALRKHGLAVEACLVAYARKFNEDENLWSITGLIHDFDWEIHPQVPDHPMKGSEILAARGVPEVIRKAIVSHVPDCTELRETPLEKALFACDELAGLLTAYAYVKPSRSIHDVDAKGVRKKMKDKAFARAVNRDDIVNGAAAMNVDLEEHIDFCIKAMQARAAELGLQGS
jgi:putative nucleotidyltransferase with HDIG domain